MRISLSPSHCNAWCLTKALCAPALEMEIWDREIPPLSFPSLIPIHCTHAAHMRQLRRLPLPLSAVAPVPSCGCLLLLPWRPALLLALLLPEKEHKSQFYKKKEKCLQTRWGQGTMDMSPKEVGKRKYHFNKLAWLQSTFIHSPPSLVSSLDVRAICLQLLALTTCIIHSSLLTSPKLALFLYFFS